VRDARGKAILGVAVVKVSLQNVTQELQAAGQKGNSLICLADPRGVVFLASRPEMILKSLWPVAEKDLPALQDQYGKDKFPAIFPEKIADGSKVDYLNHHYLASFAGTIHAGWSVFFFRPVEMVGAYRLAGIGVACILALLALAILGSNFYFKERAMTSVGRFQAMFDSAPEAIGVIDPYTLTIVEANRSLADLLGYNQKKLLNLNLENLLNQDSREIRSQLLKITGGEGAAKIRLQARKRDGDILDLEAMGSKLEHQGKEQVLIFCRKVEAWQQLSPTAILPGTDQFSQGQEPHTHSFQAESNVQEAHGTIKNILPHLKGKRPDKNPENFDQEAEVLIKRIMNALDKAEKLRKSSGN
jgi:PAS domain S-box-containing protein